ncbi:CBO0543 family protein [Bacillus alkalicellulosilyticus]|uniref:CBO0543 family protein n=1 Tax=Alkalihalobacterium alkalicellulosilyticum TaxID=1912214 RepID=UPI0009984A63|nr:CBO0543 family protein [Bacillus alkalicellulosilyticus]
MAKKVDTTIEISAWIITSIFLLIFIPKNKIREAHLSFLFKQIITWLFGLVVVETKLISYPHRTFFKRANKASFTFEYFVYPSLCSLFNVHYPEKSHYFKKILYYGFHTSLITVFEVILVKYTDLIRYPKWKWYWSFTTIWMSYYISRVYFRWFFKDSTFFSKKVLYPE